jgi:hypothetical protein
MQELNEQQINQVSGGWEGSPWYGPFEIWRPGQPIDPNSPWLPAGYLMP